MPEVARGLIQQFLSAISGGALYRKSSFLLDKVNTAVFAPHIHIHQRPYLAGGAASGWFDGEGVAVQDRTLIDAGTLTGRLLGATLPLLAEHFRRHPHAGHSWRVGVLYAANTIGAAFGGATEAATGLATLADTGLYTAVGTGMLHADVIGYRVGGLPGLLASTLAIVGPPTVEGAELVGARVEQRLRREIKYSLMIDQPVDQAVQLDASSKEALEGVSRANALAFQLTVEADVMAEACHRIRDLAERLYAAR